MLRVANGYIGYRANISSKISYRVIPSQSTTVARAVAGSSRCVLVRVMLAALTKARCSQKSIMPKSTKVVPNTDRKPEHGMAPVDTLETVVDENVELDPTLPPRFQYIFRDVSKSILHFERE